MGASTPRKAAAAFNAVVSDLGSCLYEKPANIDSQRGRFVHESALAQQSTNVTFNAVCNEAAQNTVDGWNIDAGRVRICGESCTASHGAVERREHSRSR